MSDTNLDQVQDQNQSQDDEDQPYQVTGDDLAELHGLASQLHAAGDPRAARLWDFIAAQSGGGDGPGPTFRVMQSPLKVTSWLEDLENDLWGNQPSGGSGQSAQSARIDDNGGTQETITSGPQARPGTDRSGDAEDETAGSTETPEMVGATGLTPGSSDGASDDSNSARAWDLEQGRYTPASADDIANGNYINVGFRHLLAFPRFAYHSYIQIPVIGRDGTPTGEFEKWGILGEKNNGENQQVRNDDRNGQQPGDQGKEVYVKVTPEQREALRERMEYFAQQDKNQNFLHPCPVCGPNYHRIRQNSNTFVYNMLFWNPAGMIWAPKPPRWTVKYGENMGDIGWYK